MMPTSLYPVAAPCCRAGSDVPKPRDRNSAGHPTYAVNPVRPIRVTWLCRSVGETTCAGGLGFRLLHGRRDGANSLLAVHGGDHPMPHGCALHEEQWLHCFAIADSAWQLCASYLSVRRRRLAQPGLPSAFVASPSVMLAAQYMKKHGQAWNRLATVSAMSFSEDDACMSLARRVIDALEAGDRDEALRLTRELERGPRHRPGAARSSPAGDAGVPRLGPRPCSRRLGRPRRRVPASGASRDPA
jgi:hypothetical protein